MLTSDDDVVTRVMEAINLPGVDRRVAVAAIDACRNARPSGVMSTADGTDYARGYRAGESAARTWAASWLRETADEPATCHANACDALRDAAGVLGPQEQVVKRESELIVRYLGEVADAMIRNGDQRVGAIVDMLWAISRSEHLDRNQADGRDGTVAAQAWCADWLAK